MSPVVVPVIAADGSWGTVTLPDPLVQSVVTFRDFAQLIAGMAYTGMPLPNVLNGHGATYEMVPHSSTKTVADQNGNGTNPLTLLVVGGNDDKHIVTGIDISNLRLLATPQGPGHSGFRIGWSTGARQTDVTIKSVTGSDNKPPGETFADDLWHANGVTLTRVHVDGTDSTGRPVMASGFGFNNLDGATTIDCSVHGANTGIGVTHHKFSNITHTRMNASNNRRAFNFERCSGLLQLIDDDLRGVGQLPNITLDTDGPSAHMVVTDPIIDTWPLRVGVLLGRPGKPALYEAVRKRRRRPTRS